MLTGLTDLAGAAEAKAEVGEATAQEAQELATALRRTVNGLLDLIGTPGGLAPLDDGGKVASKYLPSYVDDILEFDGKNVISLSGVYDEVPEEYADLPTGATTSGRYLQFITEEDVSKVYYCEGKGFYAGNTVAVYTGHTMEDLFCLKSTIVDLSVYGTTDENGFVVPVEGKVYVDISTNKQYRWSGSTLTELSKPTELGVGIGEAFPGTDGAALRTEFQNFRQSYTSESGDILSFCLGAEAFNINAALMSTDPFESLQDALDQVPRLESLGQNGVGWPSYGSTVVFLLKTGDTSEWSKYRCKLSVSEFESEDECFAADNWERVVEASDADSSTPGTVVCTKCEDHATEIANIKAELNDVKTTASSLSQSVTTATNKANAAHTKANSAYTIAEAAGSKADEIGTTLETLAADVETLKQSSSTGSAAFSLHDEIPFINVNDENSGCLHGAHSSGLTYSYPSTKFNLQATPADNQDVLILTPIDAELDGTVMRIIDPRMISTSDSVPAVRIQTYNSSQKIFGVEKESSDAWITLKGGYVEMMAVRSMSADGLSYSDLHWVVTKLVKF